MKIDLNDFYVENKISDVALKGITIVGLFGQKDIILDFERETNIYIGENGLGKTTILNCIYYILKNDYDKLIGISFDTIKVSFSDGEYSISKYDVMKYVRSKQNKIGRRFGGEEIFTFLEDVLQGYDPNELKNNSEFKNNISSKMAKIYGLPFSYVDSTIDSYLMFENSKRGNKENVEELIKKIKSCINEEIIYLTTYRRIEKDYSDFFDSESTSYTRREYRGLDKSLIRFGMKDVSDAINNVLDTIRTATNQGFNRMTGVLLDKYTNSSEVNSNTLDLDTVKIVLSRLGKQINERNKKNIIQLINNGRINESKYKYLHDLIGELVACYESLKFYDEKILKFVDTCNKYLNNKEFIYDQSEISLKIESRIPSMNNEVALSMLSSGEKQIVSIFSRLYLESEKKCILLIDEPELSISIQWQRMLLPDIIRSGNCSLLLTVTHSPFIFDNEFDIYARDIWFNIRKQGNE